METSGHTKRKRSEESSQSGLMETSGHRKRNEESSQSGLMETSGHRKRNEESSQSGLMETSGHRKRNEESSQSGVFKLPFVCPPLACLDESRHARRIYSIEQFFNDSLSAIGGMAAGQARAVINVYKNDGRNCAFVEMENVELASNAMALDGVMWEGLPIKIRRPRDYNREKAAVLGPTEPGPTLNLGAVGLKVPSAVGFEGSDVLFVGGLPYCLDESHVIELLESIGPLKAFNLVKDNATANSKGFGFCVYKNLHDADMACTILNGMKLKDKILTVTRSRQPKRQQDQEMVFSDALRQIRMKSNV